MEVAYNPRAQADMAKLPGPLAQRIMDKVEWFASQDDPLHFAKPMKGRDNVLRFRVGDYRILFTLNKGKIVVFLLVLAVKHRSEAYD